MTRDLYLRTAAFYLRSGNDSPLCAAGHNGESLPDLNIVMAWMTQHIQRVLDAWHHAGTRRVEGDQLRHIAPVHFQGINLRGVLQFPLARYRNRLILEAPSRARQRANTVTGDEDQSQETIDFV